MIIINSTGIETALLCPANKRYLSRLLVGTTGINPGFITWKQLLKQVTITYPFLLNPFSEEETSNSLSKKIKKWNQRLIDGKLKSHILKNLDQCEKEHNELELKKNLYNLKKKSTIAPLIILVVSMGIFSPLFLLMPVTMSIMLIVTFTLATLVFTSIFTLDLFYPTILQTEQNTGQCKQSTALAQKVKSTLTLSETENRGIRVSSRSDRKKVPLKHTPKSSVFKNKLKTPTLFFHFTHEKTRRQKSNGDDINTLDTATAHLNQNLCAVLV